MYEDSVDNSAMESSMEGMVPPQPKVPVKSAFSRNYAMPHAHSQSSKTLDSAQLQAMRMNNPITPHEHDKGGFVEASVDLFSSTMKTQSITSGLGFDMRKKSVPNVSYAPGGTQIQPTGSNPSPGTPQPITIIKNPERITDRLIDKIQEFWKRHHPMIDHRKCRFKEESLPSVQRKLEEFDKYLSQLKKPLKLEPTSEDLAFFQGNMSEAVDALKQSFFLNLCNFMILYQLALLLISNPEAIEKLTSFNMWQAFLDNTTITLNGCKLKAITIMQVILKATPKKQTAFPITSMIAIPKMASTSTKFKANGERVSGVILDSLEEMCVVEPNPLIAFGLFLPLPGSATLHKYTVKNLAIVLRENAQEYVIKHMSIRDDYHTLILPKIFRWFKQHLLAAGSKDCEQVDNQRLLKAIYER